MRRAAGKMQHSVGAVGRNLFRVRSARMAATRSFPNRGRTVSTIQADDRPRLKPGCRLSESEAQSGTLVVPEGAIRLNGPAIKIVAYVNGQRTFDDIVSELRREFPGADPVKIERDTANLLEQFRAKGIVSWENV